MGFHNRSKKLKIIWKFLLLWRTFDSIIVFGYSFSFSIFFSSHFFHQMKRNFGTACTLPYFFISTHGMPCMCTETSTLWPTNLLIHSTNFYRVYESNTILEDRSQPSNLLNSLLLSRFSNYLTLSSYKIFIKKLRNFIFLEFFFFLQKRPIAWEILMRVEARSEFLLLPPKIIRIWIFCKIYFSFW